MASLKQLKDKIKTFNDISKVINIQKISVMKEISDIKKIIAQVKFRGIMFNNLMLDINKRYNVFHSSMFDAKKARTPNRRTLHFIMGNPKTDKLGKYAFNLLLEHARKKHNSNDVYVVIDTELADYLEKKGLNVIKKIKLTNMLTDTTIYQRISWQLYNGHKDLMFDKAGFMYLSLITRNIQETQIFPFNNKKTEMNVNELEGVGISNDIFLSINPKKAKWIKNISIASEKIAKLALEMRAYMEIVEYRLSLKTRELQSLDDKEKNIKEEVEKVKLSMQRIRKENITNELLTSAVAFSVVGTGGDE